MSMTSETPQIVIKAIVAEMVEEFNRQRTWQSKPLITAEQVRASIEGRIAQIRANIAAHNDSDFEWINEGNKL